MVILGHNLGNSQVSVYRTIGPTLVYVCMLFNCTGCVVITHLSVSKRGGVPIIFPSFSLKSGVRNGTKVRKHAIIISYIDRINSMKENNKQLLFDMHQDNMSV